MERGVAERGGARGAASAGGADKRARGVEAAVAAEAGEPYGHGDSGEQTTVFVRLRLSQETTIHTFGAVHDKPAKISPFWIWAVSFSPSLAGPSGNW